MKKILIIILSLFIVGCASTIKKSLSLEPGMSKQSVFKILGTPENRSFKGDNEAWQYQEIVGFGQCSYLTAWFSRGTLIAVTSRRGRSVAGCGIGSREVDWGQMPKPSLDLNINIKSKK